MSMSPEQRKAASLRMKALQEKRKAAKLAASASKEEGVLEQSEQVPPPQPVEVDPVPQVLGEQSLDDLRRQVLEMQSAMIKMMGQPGQSGQSNVSLGDSGKVLGVVEKYVLDPDRYPDPCERLTDEPRLQPMAFKLNYELYYKFSTSSYETKSGVNMTEPKFQISLTRVVLNDEGMPTDKRYVVKNMIFHEDPQAAIVIAREKGISLDDYKDMDNTDVNQRKFLNEMRYLRVRDWLFDTFWAKPASIKEGIREEVIGGKIVQVFMKNSAESTGVDFDKIDGKMRV